VVKAVTFILKTKKGVAEGFTLVELLIVITVTGIIVAALLLLLPPIINRTGKTVDIASVKLLNKATALYKMTQMTTGSDIFKGFTTDIAKLEELYNTGNMDRIPVPNGKGSAFVWGISEQKWNIVHVLAASEITMGTGGHAGFIKEPYTGDPSQKDIVIPNSINGEPVNAIYQDVFSGKGLTSVVIEEGITRIHARAFKDNKLTEIVLPNSMARLDYGAFMDSGLTKITIGQGVYLEGNVFPKNDSFIAAYIAGGAGTYILSGVTWVKQ
jgi:prepilin-type N-terminal cleavage/methylation domain-containing protein